MLSIDKYAYSSRNVSWSPNMKALIWFVGIILAFQPIEFIKPVLVVGVACWTVYLTKVSFRQYFRWFYAIIPFLILSIIGIVFTVTAQKSSVIFPVKLFGAYLGLSKTMMPLAFRVTLRCIAAITCTYWFALTTPFVQIIQVLKKLRIPRTMIEITMLMYRFIFIFVDCFERIYRAQKLRFGYDSFELMMRSSGILAKMLFEQIIINYEMMIKALDAKLYDGDFYI